MGWEKGEIVLWCSWMKKLNCRKRRHRHRTDFHSWYSGHATFLGISLPISNPQWKLIHRYRGKFLGTQVRWGCETDILLHGFAFLSPALCHIYSSLPLSLLPLPPEPDPALLMTGFQPPPALHHFGFPQLFLGRDAEASVSQHLSLHFLTVTNGEHLSVDSLLHS